MIFANISLNVFIKKVLVKKRKSVCDTEPDLLPKICKSFIVKLPLDRAEKSQQTHLTLRICLHLNELLFFDNDSLFKSIWGMLVMFFIKYF